MSSPRPADHAVNAWSPEYLEAQYRRYQEDPASLSEVDRAFFRGFDLALADGTLPTPVTGVPRLGEGSSFQVAVDGLIKSYRTLGHIAAKLDPFGRDRERPEALSLEYHRLSEEDLERKADASLIGLGPDAPLRLIIDHLEATYCGSTGLECMHLSDSEERHWLTGWFERRRGRLDLSPDERIQILSQLLGAEAFEHFLGKRYPGEKRFSLEGSESAIPLIERVVDRSSRLGAIEIVIGMAHRGRLNVLSSILGKTHAQIFTEFEDTWEEDFADGGGDVKYHRGYSGSRSYDDGRKLHLTLTSNPSHLEAVDPVVLGRTRAKQGLRGGASARAMIVPLIIHGDAAVSGQGMVAECLNLSQLSGYRVGGTIHVVVNNLIGFTTSPEYARSSRYCTDIAKSIEAPVIHVNGEDPEAVVAAAELASDYRYRFQKDVFIDLWCYRRFGHNEQDEASFTQPIMARLIREQISVLTLYSQRLFAEGVIDEADLDTIRNRLLEALEQAQQHARLKPYDPTIDPGSARWHGIRPKYSHTPVETGVPMTMLTQVCEALGTVPAGFKLNPKLKRVLSARKALPETKEISYADAESLAFGTLLLEGTPIRMSGQDCRRGTFSHRHAGLADYETGEPYEPLNNILPLHAPESDESFRAGEEQAKICIHDSPLSEESVLGFEYGYALVEPSMLVMWEAQFGDFVNGAQTIIDQFIASAEAKWDRWNGLVMLLPHGYEGMGPEHSSGRMERFLKLCASDNMQVVVPSTAAQAFHMFRRQVRRAFRKPLIVYTPKSLLRKTTSTIDELVSGRFEELLDDPYFAGEGAPSRSGVRRIAMCAGKLYWELDERRRANGRDDVAIIRVEQVYPFHDELFKDIRSRYPADAELVWAQEEPRNAGAGLFIADRLRQEHSIELPYVGRPASATPATGSKRKHKSEQEAIISAIAGPLASEDAEPTLKVEPAGARKKAASA